MKWLLAGVLCLMLAALLPANAQFPPTHVQDVDLTGWEDIADNYHFRLNDVDLIIRKSGNWHSIYTFPDLDILGTLVVTDDDRLLALNDVSFDLDPGIEVLMSHRISYNPPLDDYYIIDLDSGDHLFEFTHEDGFEEYLGRIGIWDSCGLNEVLLNCWGVTRRAGNGNLVMELYALDDETGDFVIWDQAEIEAGWKLYSLNQFYADNDPGLEAVLLQEVEETDFASYSNAIRVFEFDSHSISWVLEERETIFHVTHIPDWDPSIPRLNVYFELTTDFEDGSILYEVLAPPGQAPPAPHPFQRGDYSKGNMPDFHGFRRQP